ncbi:MAG: SGNH/GDSL hydrolase family protein [Candidatus Saccharimonadales bacterium]
MSKLVFIALVVGIAVLGGGYAIFAMLNKSQSTHDIAFGVGLSYVAVGDSYSIGEGETEAMRWSNQLVEQLNARGKRTYLAANLSRTGYTTQDILKREIKTLKKANPDLVTLQIGVNDYVRGATPDEFKNSYAKTVEAVQSAAPNAKLLLVTIPDYGKTPTGATFGDPDATESGIRKYNKIIITEATNRNLMVVDIFAISQQSSNAGELVADGLHPSGAQYAKWLTLITPKVEQLLRTN